MKNYQVEKLNDFFNEMISPSELKELSTTAAINVAILVTDDNLHVVKEVATIASLINELVDCLE